MYHPTRGGVRGGRDQFNWEDIKGDKHRENYLGHSIKAPVGRWQKGKDLHWYAKDRQSDEAAAREEIKRLKEEEEDAMQEMLGLAPKKNGRNQLDAREMSEVLKKVKEGAIGSDPSYGDGERVQGLGFAGQATPRQPGSGQTGPDKSGNVTFEKISPVINEQRTLPSSGDEVNRDFKKDGMESVAAQGARKIEGEDKTSSSSPEEEGISSRKRRRGKRREEKRHKHKRRKSTARESEQEELSDRYHGDANDGERKVRSASEGVETVKGHTERKSLRHKDQSRNHYLSNERHDNMVFAKHDREGSQGGLQRTSKTTSRRDYRSHQTRNGKARHDSDSEDTEGNLQETVGRTSRGDYRSHHRRNSKLRNDSDSEESQGQLQDTVNISREEHISHYGSKARHDSDSDDRQGKFPGTVNRTSVHPNSQSRRDSRLHYSRNGNVRHDSDSEGLPGRLQDTFRTSRRDHRSHRTRIDNVRHDSDSEGIQGRLQEAFRTSRTEHRSRRSRDGNVRHGSDRAGSQGRLQETVRTARIDYKSRDSRDGNGRHEKDKETQGTVDHERQRSSTNDKKRNRRRHDSD